MAALLNSDKIYVASDKYAAVAAWAASTIYSAGARVRQLATPAVGSERVFVCIIAGTSLTGEPAWTLTKGATTAEAAGPTWQEVTGQPPVNGDVTNTLAWTASAKSNTVVLGQIIKRDNAASYQICTTAGTCGSGAEPAFSDTAGVTTTDNTVVWTSLGVVGGFAAWSAPHARLNNAFAATWATVIGSVFYVASTHAETQATANILVPNGTTPLPCHIISVGATVAPPTAYAVGASVTTTGASALTLSGASNIASYRIRGFTFNAGTGASAADLVIGSNDCNSMVLENCTFNVINTASTSGIRFRGGVTGLSGNLIRVINCAFTFSAVGQKLQDNANAPPNIDIIGGSIAATGSIPTTLVSSIASRQQCIKFRDVDLSTVVGTLMAVGAFYNGEVSFSNCKLGAAVTMTSGAQSGAGMGKFSVINCDSGTKNYRFYESEYLAVLQSETTVVRTGGASDGVTPLSFNIATGSSVAINRIPYICKYPISVWNDTVGSAKTATIEIAGATTLTNADIWMEVEYLGSTLTPLGSIVNNRVDDSFTTPANVTASSAAWGGSPAVTQKLQVTFTPQMKGLIRARIFIAKASTTVYIDPLITIT